VQRIKAAATVSMKIDYAGQRLSGSLLVFKNKVMHLVSFHKTLMRIAVPLYVLDLPQVRSGCSVASGFGHW